MSRKRIVKPCETVCQSRGPGPFEGLVTFQMMSGVSSAGEANATRLAHQFWARPSLSLVALSSVASLSWPPVVDRRVASPIENPWRVRRAIC
jgi:hypothetical protein